MTKSSSFSPSSNLSFIFILINALLDSTENFYFLYFDFQRDQFNNLLFFKFLLVLLILLIVLYIFV